MATALAIIGTLPNGNYPAGVATATIAPVAVPLTDFYLQATIDVTNHVDATQAIDILVEISQDAGVTWDTLIGAHRGGGTIFDKNHVALPNTILSIGMAGIGNPDRQVRLSVDITTKALVLSGNIQTGTIG